MDLRHVIQVVNRPCREQVTHRDLTQLGMAADSVQIVVPDELAQAPQLLAP